MADRDKTTATQVNYHCPSSLPSYKNRSIILSGAGLLFCQPTEISTDTLIQKYFDRWQIEVNHREEKDTLGVGQAQVRSHNSVPRQPAFVVAAYSAMLLAGIICFEDKEGGIYGVA